MAISAEVIHGDCTEVLPTLNAGSIDAVICDPPYPYIKREYGWWDEASWRAMMDPVITECRRVLKPTGSAIFILQPNSERVGRMRTWLLDFVSHWAKEWGWVQDAYWWNTCAMTVGGCGDKGTLRPAVRICVWLGLSSCYRNQSAVLWSESDESKAKRLRDRCDSPRPSGWRGDAKPKFDSRRRRDVAVKRGGVVPFNVIPMGNQSNQHVGAGALGHAAGTPLTLMRWWTRYLCPPGGTILDPFGGSGTAALAALQEGRSAVLIERKPEYVDIARRRIAEATAAEPLFAQEAT